MTREIIVPGQYDRIAEVCKFIAAGAAECGFDEDELFRIELACDEACTNVIEHAYGGEISGDIHVAWQLLNNAFTIIICDNGSPFDPKSVPTHKMPAAGNHLDDLRIGGLGIHFMRKLMDEVHFSADDVCGNKLVMVKYMPGSQEK